MSIVHYRLKCRTPFSDGLPFKTEAVGDEEGEEKEEEGQEELADSKPICVSTCPSP